MRVYQAVLVHSINNLKGGEQEITVYCGDEKVEAIMSLSSNKLEKFMKEKNIITEIFAKKINIYENGKLDFSEYIYRDPNYIVNKF